MQTAKARGAQSPTCKAHVATLVKRGPKYSRKLPYVRKNLKVNRLESIEYSEYKGSETCTLKEALLTSVEDMVHAKRVGGNLYCVHIPGTRKVDLCFVHQDCYEHFVLHLEDA
jgi:hypothetical protein